MKFEESIYQKIDGAEISPSPELWDRVSTSLDSAAAKSPLGAALRWCGAIAAALAVALAANLWLESSSTIEIYESQIAEFKAVQSEPRIALESPTLLEPRATMIATVAPKGDTPEPIPLEPTPLEPPLSVEPPVEAEATLAEDLPRQQESRGEGFSGSDFPLATHSTRNSRRGVTLSMMVGGGGATSSSSSSIAPVSYLTVAYPNSYSTELTVREYSPQSANHNTPVSAALSVAYLLGDRWSLESGVNYTGLHSQITMSYATDQMRQRVDLLGVPLRLNYNILASESLLLYAGAGAMVERCLSAKLDGKRVDERAWHSSLDGVLGLQYNINRWLGIYTEPELTYHLTQTTLTTIRSESSLSFNVRFGLRFMLSSK